MELRSAMGAFTKENRTGYKFKSKSEGKSLSKLPFLCPYEKCGRITDSMDDVFLRKYGICAKCYIEYVEERKEPLVDVEYYKSRLEERGF